MSKKHLILLGAAVVLAATVGLVAAQAHGVAPWAGFAGERGRGGFTDNNGTVSGRGVSFTVDAATATISNLDPTAINGTHPMVSSVQLGLPAGASATARSFGRAYALDDAVGDRIVVADVRGASFAATSENGTTVTIVLPEGASIATHDAVASWSPAGATITYANGDVGNLVLSKNATLARDGQTLTVKLGPRSAASFGPAMGEGFQGEHGDGFGFARGFPPGRPEREGFGGHGGRPGPGRR